MSGGCLFCSGNGENVDESILPRHICLNKVIYGLHNFLNQCISERH